MIAGTSLGSMIARNPLGFFGVQDRILDIRVGDMDYLIVTSAVSATIGKHHKHTLGVRLEPIIGGKNQLLYLEELTIDS